MGNIIMLSEFFLFSLALGLGFYSFLANTKETGAGFLKVLVSICGASSLTAFGLHQTYGSLTDTQSLLYLLATTLFTIVYFYHKDEKNFFTWTLYLFHNATLVLLLKEMNNSNLEHFVFSLSSVMFLGSVTYAMIMGHWYLVTPRLSEKPLIYATYFTWFFLLIKLVWTVVGVTENLSFFDQFTREGGGYAFNWLMLSMRTVGGYFVLGIMSIFAYKLIKMRSIQSATGMLYAMTFFIFISELISMFMFLNYGIYL